jgi:hypothetical protein
MDAYSLVPALVSRKYNIAPAETEYNYMVNPDILHIVNYNVMMSDAPDLGCSQVRLAG